VSRDDEESQAPRYSDAAGVENHPQVTDFVPRRYRTIALLVLCGAASASLLGLLHYFQATLFGRLGLEGTHALDIASGGSLSAWVQVVVLLLAAALCLLIYSIRRHRIDDIRGRYRIWLAAMAACLFLSANSVAGVHQILADVLGNVVGWTALRDGAIWWLALGGLPATWILLRTLLDVVECRLSTALLVAASICYVVSGMSFLGVVPVEDAKIATVATSATLMMGHWLAFAAAVAQARFVILDAQGLIVIRPRVERKRNSKSTESDSIDDAKLQGRNTKSIRSLDEVSGSPQSGRSASKADRDTVKQWVDGSSPERDPYDDDGDSDGGGPDDDRKLSKSDRKRMRKLKAQSRAA
jgi:hypothetical protein